jgi:IMP dehydrogenase
MKNIDIPTCLSFDDVMLVPVFSDIKSRSEPSTKTKVGFIELDLPIISSPMDTVTEYSMARAISKLGGMGIIHRFMSPEEQAKMLGDIFNEMEVGCENYSSLKNTFGTVGPSIGVGDQELERLKIIIDKTGLERLTTVCIDVANGFSSYMRDTIDCIRNKYGDKINIIAGNVATGEGYNFLARSGADAVRCGIGGGSICSTRIQTGVGIPTLSSIIDCARLKGDKSASIIADGGIRYPGDLAKSIATGADAVMVGRIFAASDEAPGRIIDGMKIYRGMASFSVQSEKRGGLKEGTCAEGVTTQIRCTGPIKGIVQEFRGGLISSMSYLNARNLKEYRLNARLIRITSAGIEESHAFGTKK